MSDFCFIRLDGKYIKVHFDDIIYIEAHKNYPRIYLKSHSFVALITMVKLENRLPPNLFCRVHRSYIVSIKHISSFDSHHLYLGEKALPLTKNYFKLLQKKLFIIDSEQALGPQVRLSVHFPADERELN